MCRVPVGHLLAVALISGNNKRFPKKTAVNPLSRTSL